MKFSTVVLGTRAERPVTVDIRGAACAFALRPLTGTEEAAALAEATEFAKTRRAEQIAPGNALFDLGLMIATLAIACVDPDSPAGARAPFFDGGASQIADALDSEQIAYLYARYELWQADCSPSQRAKSGDELIRLLIDVVEAEDDLPFSRARLADVWKLLRITGALFLTSPEHRSQATSLFAANTTPR